MPISDAQVKRIRSLAIKVARDHASRSSLGRFEISDLASIAIIAALERFDHYDPSRGAFTTYFYRRMAGEIRDAIRHDLYPRSMLFSELDGRPDPRADQDPARRMMIREELEQVRQALFLTRREWLLITLRFGQGYTQQEVSRVFGISAMGIAQMERRIRLRMGRVSAAAEPAGQGGRARRQGFALAHAIAARRRDVSRSEGARQVQRVTRPADLRPDEQRTTDDRPGKGRAA